MKIKCHYRNDPERGDFDPVLEEGERSFVFRLYSGDVLRPFGGNWFSEPWPKYVFRHTFKWSVLPFIAWRWPFLKRVGYIGFKPFGASREEYPQYGNWMKDADTEPGSIALCPSFRPFALPE